MRYKTIVARQLYTQHVNKGHTETAIALIDGGAEIDVTRNILARRLYTGASRGVTLGPPRPSWREG
jgi:hypothetical protein